MRTRLQICLRWVTQQILHHRLTLSCLKFRCNTVSQLCMPTIKRALQKLLKTYESKDFPVHLTVYSSPNRHANPHHFGHFSFFLLTTLNHNQQRNKEKTVMSFFAHLLKTPNRHADDFGVFNATQRCLSCLVSFVAFIKRDITDIFPTTSALQFSTPES